MANVTPGKAEAPPSMNGRDNPSTANPDPFDPQAIIINAMADVNVETVLTAVPVRKPKRTEFVRVHPDPDYMVPCML